MNKRLVRAVLIASMLFGAIAFTTAGTAHAATVPSPTQHATTHIINQQAQPHAVSGGGCYSDAYDTVCVSLNSQYKIVTDVYIHACFDQFAILLYDDYGQQGGAIFLNHCSGHFYGPSVLAYSGGAFWTCLSGTLASGANEYNCSPTQYT